MRNVAFKPTVINHRQVRQTYRLIVWAYFAVETTDVTAWPSEIDSKQQSAGFSDKFLTCVRPITQLWQMATSHTILTSVLTWKSKWDKVCMCIWQRKGHTLVEVWLCGYSYEFRGLLHGIKELVVVVLVAGLTFSSSCRSFKVKRN